jgi:hypothetical protein
MLPVVATLGLSFRRPAYVDRFLIGSLPPLMLAVAAGVFFIGRLRPWIGIAAATLFVLFMGWGTLRLFDRRAYPREDWRSLALLIHHSEKPGDVIVLREVYYLLPFRYYYQGQSEVLALDSIVTQPAYSAGMTANLWLVYRGKLEDSHRFADSVAPEPSRDELDPAVKGWLETFRVYNPQREDFAGLAVFHYEPGAAGSLP